LSSGYLTVLAETIVPFMGEVNLGAKIYISFKLNANADVYPS
jgi:hypothetical protein